MLLMALRNLSISASCHCNSRSISSPSSEIKAESLDDEARVLSMDKPNPVETDRTCKKSTDEI